MVRRVAPSRATWLCLAALVPAVVVGAIDARALAMALVGAHPRWPDHNLNLSEAAAVRDNAEVVRQLEQGSDPDLRRPVRPGLVGNDREVAATPLEAAVSIRRTELISLLFQGGARLAPADWRRLTCAARALKYGDVVTTLEMVQPDGVEATCAGDESLW